MLSPAGTQGASPLPDGPLRVASLPSPSAGEDPSPFTLRESESVFHTLGSKDPYCGGAFRWSGRVQGLRAWGRSLRTPTCRRGHLQYLRSGPPYDFPRYRSTVHEVTQAFAAASREVLAVEAELAGPRGQPLLASHVRSLQQLEQTRLATVRPPPRPLSPSPRLVCRGLSGHPNPAPAPQTPFLPAPPQSSTKVSLGILPP